MPITGGLRWSKENRSPKTLLPPFKNGNDGAPLPKRGGVALGGLGRFGVVVLALSFGRCCFGAGARGLTSWLKKFICNYLLLI